MGSFQKFQHNFLTLNSPSVSQNFVEKNFTSRRIYTRHKDHPIKAAGGDPQHRRPVTCYNQNFEPVQNLGFHSAERICAVVKATPRRHHESILLGAFVCLKGTLMQI